MWPSARPPHPRVEPQKPAREAALPQWVTGLLRNDARTLQVLYERHFPAVQRHVKQHGGTGDDAQDAFQEAVTVLWLSVKEGRITPEADPGGFLFRVSRNKWIDQTRSAAKHAMRMVHDERAEEDSLAEEVEERLARLRAVYERMEDKCRDVLDRFYYRREDLATIAAATGVTEESIRTIKYRCMMKLRAFRKQIEQGELPNE